MKNKAISSKNTSGVNGVRLDKDGKWSAFIGLNGKPKYIGCYPTIEEAEIVRLSADKEYGYHENHSKRPPLDLGLIKTDIKERKHQCYLGNYERLDHLMMIRKVRS